MTATLWATLAAACAILAEYLYRKSPGGWVYGAHYFLPIQVGISFALYQLMNVPKMSFLGAFVVFSCCTVVLRVAVSLLVLGDDVSMGTWIAMVLIISARVVQAWV